jgi:cytochrome c oxidase subunit 4
MKPSAPVSLRSCLLVWLALLGLLLLTAGSAYLPLGNFNLAVSLAIALLKAFLVMAFFMNLRRERATTRLFAVAGFVWLAALIGLTLADVMTR